LRFRHIVPREGSEALSKEFIYNGTLTEATLPEMLAIIHRYHVPGVMELRRADTVNHIFIIDGDVIFATSCDRGESLGDYLLAKGKISKAQLRVSTDEMIRSPGKRHGSILVELGFLKPEELGPAVREQVQMILWSMFDWEEGEGTFRVGRFREDEVFKIKIPAPRAILSGCKRIRDGRRLTDRLGGRNVVFQPVERPDYLSGLRLEAGERRLLELIDGQRTFLELCEQGPFSVGLNARILYALFLLQLIEKSETPSSGIRIQVRNSDSG